MQVWEGRRRERGSCKTGGMGQPIGHEMRRYSAVVGAGREVVWWLVRVRAGSGASLCLATGGMEPTVHEDLSAVYCERAQCSAVYAIVCGRAYLTYIES